MDRSDRKLVELLGVPKYDQGAFGSLCVHAASAMLLATIRPKYGRRFGEGEVGGGAVCRIDDPLIAHHSDRDKSRALARWFFNGEELSVAARILNRIEGRERAKRKLFLYEERNFVDATFYGIASTIEEHGLPVMLAWDSRDFGSHAVVAFGVDHTSGRHRWLLINDPSGVSDEISWDSLRASRSSRLQIVKINPELFDGPRPDRRIVVRKSEKIERWWFGPNGLGWYEVHALFDSLRPASDRQQPKSRRGSAKRNRSREIGSCQ